MMAVAADVLSLQLELDKAKESLVNVDENIKKLTGRDPSDQRLGLAGRRVPAAGTFARLAARQNPGARQDVSSAGASLVRRRPGIIFSRLGPRTGAGREGPDSGDEEDYPHKPAVQSSVIAPPPDVHSKQDLIQSQNTTDSRGKDRNRRMFGLLMGTLRKFKNEANDFVNMEKEHRRQVIDKKLEEQEQQEKEELRKERESLFLARREKQRNIRRIEQKMELVRMFEEWEKHRKSLMSFIQTRSKPHLFYKSRKSHPILTRRREDSTAKLEGIIEERKKELEAEIARIDGISIDEEEEEENSQPALRELENGKGEGAAEVKAEKDINLDQNDAGMQYKEAVDSGNQGGLGSGDAECLEKGMEEELAGNLEGGGEGEEEMEFEEMVEGKKIVESEVVHAPELDVQKSFESSVVTIPSEYINGKNNPAENAVAASERIIEEEQNMVEKQVELHKSKQEEEKTDADQNLKTEKLKEKRRHSREGEMEVEKRGSKGRNKNKKQPEKRQGDGSKRKTTASEDVAEENWNVENVEKVNKSKPVREEHRGPLVTEDKRSRTKEIKKKPRDIERSRVSLHSDADSEGDDKQSRKKPRSTHVHSDVESENERKTSKSAEIRKKSQAKEHGRVRMHSDSEGEGSEKELPSAQSKKRFKRKEHGKVSSRLDSESEEESAKQDEWERLAERERQAAREKRAEKRRLAELERAEEERQAQLDRLEFERLAERERAERDKREAAERERKAEMEKQAQAEKERLEREKLAAAELAEQEMRQKLLEQEQERQADIERLNKQREEARKLEEERNLQLEEEQQKQNVTELIPVLESVSRGKIKRKWDVRPEEVEVHKQNALKLVHEAEVMKSWSQSPDTIGRADTGRNRSPPPPRRKGWSDSSEESDTEPKTSQETDKSKPPFHLEGQRHHDKLKNVYADKEIMSDKDGSKHSRRENSRSPEKTRGNHSPGKHRKRSSSPNQRQRQKHRKKSQTPDRRKNKRSVSPPREKYSRSRSRSQPRRKHRSTSREKRKKSLTPDQKRERSITPKKKNKRSATPVKRRRRSITPDRRKGRSRTPERRRKRSRSRTKSRTPVRKRPGRRESRSPIRRKSKSRTPVRKRSRTPLHKGSPRRRYSSPVRSRRSSSKKRGRSPIKKKGKSVSSSRSSSSGSSSRSSSASSSSHSSSASESEKEKGAAISVIPVLGSNVPVPLSNKLFD